MTSYEVSFQMFICRVDIFLSEVAVKVFGPFFNGSIFFSKYTGFAYLDSNKLDSKTLNLGYELPVFLHFEFLPL